MLSKKGRLLVNDVLEAAAREHVEVFERETSQLPVRCLLRYLYCGRDGSDVVVIADADEHGAVDVGSSASRSITGQL